MKWLMSASLAALFVVPAFASPTSKGKAAAEAVARAREKQVKEQDQRLERAARELEHLLRTDPAAAERAKRLFGITLIRPAP